MSLEDIENIRKAIEEQPDIAIHEIKSKLRLSASDETIRLKVVTLGLRYKKTLHASEQKRPDIQDKWEWQET